MKAAAAAAGAFFFFFVFSACDWRPFFAQNSAFAAERAELLEQCCACLASSATTDPAATCAEAFIVDGGVRVPDDAVFGDPNPDGGVAIPCLCGGIDKNTCKGRLEADGEIVIPGACTDQVDGPAPCEAACAGVLNFTPLAS